MSKKCANYNKLYIFEILTLRLQDLNFRFFEPAREGKHAKKLIEVLTKSSIEIPDFIAEAAANAPDEEECAAAPAQEEEDEW